MPTRMSARTLWSHGESERGRGAARGGGIDHSDLGRARGGDIARGNVGDQLRAADELCGAVLAVPLDARAEDEV